MKKTYECYVRYEYQDDMQISEKWHKDSGFNILHREDDLPAVKILYEWNCDYIGRTENYGNALFPRITKKYLQQWYKDGKLHREVGPAIIYPEGKEEYYLEGKRYSNLEFKNELNYRKEQKELKDRCDGKIIDIDGKKYKLSLI